MRRAFEARTGAFRPEDAWFEVRSRAFWDDAVCTQGFAKDVEGELDEEARAWVSPLLRAHRGLLQVSSGADEGPVVLEDLWTGAEFVVDAIDTSSREALSAATGLFDARLVGGPLGSGVTVAMLPGALYHPEDASDAMGAVLAEARVRRLGTGDSLDALLRMERLLRTLSRVKTSYAYRIDALPRAPDAPRTPA